MKLKTSQFSEEPFASRASASTSGAGLPVADEAGELPSVFKERVFLNF